MLLKPSRIEKVNPKCSWKFKFVGIIGLGKVINARLQERPTFIQQKTHPSDLKLFSENSDLDQCSNSLETPGTLRWRCIAVAPRLLVRTTCTSVGTSAFDMSPSTALKMGSFFGGADFVGKRLNTLYAESVSEDLNSPNMGLERWSCPKPVNFFFHDLP